MAKKQTSPEVSASAARLMGLTDDEIYARVVGNTHAPHSVMPHGVGFEQFCRDIRSVAASALAQDETKGQ